MASIYDPYPALLPCPNWNYSEGITQQARRTRMECGWARQRPRWGGTSNTTVDLSWEMDTTTFNTWSVWMNEFGYDWFAINLDRYDAGQVEHDMRLISPYQYSYGAYDDVSVTARGEFLT